MRNQLVRHRLLQWFVILLWSSALVFLVNSKSWALVDEPNPVLNEGHWSVDASPLKCALEHPVEDYGIATFSKLAGMRQAFTVTTHHRQPLNTKATLNLTSPTWHRSQSQQSIGEVKVMQGYRPIHLVKATPTQLLSGLKLGNNINIVIHEGPETTPHYTAPEHLQVPALGFNNAFERYQSCLNTLNPFNEDTSQHQVIRFPSNSRKVSNSAEGRLSALAQWVTLDDSIHKVRIEGHSDSKGSYRANRELANRRMDSVKSSLINAGVPEHMLELKGFADRKPIGSNLTSEGRALNRRVEVRLYRN